jgi:hypothetical protein
LQVEAVLEGGMREEKRRKERGEWRSSLRCMR